MKAVCIDLENLHFEILLTNISFMKKILIFLLQECKMLDHLCFLRKYNDSESIKCEDGEIQRGHKGGETWEGLH